MPTSKMPINCNECECKFKSLFEHCSDEEIYLIDQAKNRNTYNKNEFIFERGNLSLGLHCIQSGKVKLVSYSESGVEKIVDIKTPGDFIGYGALFTNKRHGLSAIAIEPTISCLVLKNEILKLIEKNKSVTFKVLEVISNDVNTSHSFQAEVSFDTVMSRLISVLIELNSVYDRYITMPRKSLAQMAGTSEETLSRIIRHLKQEGLIESERKSIRVKDIGKLRNYRVKFLNLKH